MRHHPMISIIAASLACAWAPAVSYAQTASAAPTTTTTTGTAATTAGTTTTGTAVTTASPQTEGGSRYLMRLQNQYPELASRTNLESLVHGLRTGSAITLTSTQGTTGTSTTFTPPTRPMGYGNITRAMTLATRQLSAAGITNPTPQQLQTALMGGTLTTASGTVRMQGVLQLRSQGMGWGQVAHTLGVQPGMGTRHAEAVASTTASGITTAGGSTTVASAKKTEHAPVGGRGIVTAAGSSPTTASYRDHGGGYKIGGTIVAANAGQGLVNGGGSGAGSGGAKAHGGKH
jgi:hypothetical protein